jgi:hypothetical protein
VLGVGTEVKPLSSVGRADAVCSQYRRRNGVLRRFQVSTNKVEPAESNRRISLFSKDEWRAALADEGIPVRPEVTRVIKTFAFACDAEAGARTGASPDGTVVRPSGKPEGVAPDADAGEPVALGISHNIGCFDILDAPFVYVSRRNQAAID